MTDPLSMLGDELQRAALRVGASARGPRRPRRGRARLSRGLVLLCSGVALAGGGASAAVVLNSQSSAPLSGTIAATQPGLAADQYDIRIGPYLNAGSAGWCVGVSYTTGGGLSSWSEQCSYELGGATPLIAESASWPTPARPTLNWAITAPQVAAVRFGDRVVLTRGDPRLPDGFRAAVELLPPGHAPAGAVQRRARPSAMPGGAVEAQAMAVEALDGRGRVIPASPSYRTKLTSGRGLPKRPHAGQAPELAPARVFWMPPAGPPRIPCAIDSTALPGPRPQWGDVATRLEPLEGLAGRAFLPCADTEFYWDGWPLQAAVLLDAADPGSPPAALPQSRPVPGHPGIFDTPGGIQGHLTGRRVDGAWLVVQGGRSLQERLLLLSHLTVRTPILDSPWRSQR